MGEEEFLAAALKRTMFIHQSPLSHHCDRIVWKDVYNLLFPWRLIVVISLELRSTYKLFKETLFVLFVMEYTYSFSVCVCF